MGYVVLEIGEIYKSVLATIVQKEGTVKLRPRNRDIPHLDVCESRRLETHRLRYLEIAGNFVFGKRTFRRSWRRAGKQNNNSQHARSKNVKTRGTHMNCCDKPETDRAIGRGAKFTIKSVAHARVAHITRQNRHLHIDIEHVEILARGNRRK